MISRQAYVIPKAGSLRNITLRQEELPPPQPHEVMVAVKAIGLNYADLFAMMGLYSATPKGSFVPGLEYAGEIIAVGSAVKDRRVGTMIMGVTRFGAYASHLNIDARYVIPLPGGWSYAEGAAFLVQVLTAYYALVPLGNLQPGQAVLIHSAAGGVGLQANRLAKKLGAFTIGVVGSAAKVPLLQREGYDDWVVRSPQFKSDVLAALKGRQLNLVLEAAGGKFFTWSYQLLAPQGRLVTYGSASFSPTGPKPNYLTLVWKFLRRPRLDPLRMPTENKSVMGFNLIWLYEKADLLHQLVDEILALGLPAPFVGHAYPFTQLPQALDVFLGGNTTGKVVVEIG